MVRFLRLASLLFVAMLWNVLAQVIFAQGVPRAECFPVEKLAPHLRPQAEQILLRMLDREGLYTVIGGLKPMSSGFAALSFSVEPLDETALKKLIDLRTILQTFRCGDELYADMLVFRRTYNGKKVAHAIVINTQALRETIRKYKAFFARLGITENSHPMEVVMVVEHAPPSERHRGYGYLFGYPKYAVDFFVEAFQEQERTGKFVERDFFSVPTYEREKHQFVWAVPKGHQPNEEDIAILKRAQQILEKYRVLRNLYVGDNKPGVIEMLRDWLDDGTGYCSLRNAESKTLVPEELVPISEQFHTIPRFIVFSFFRGTFQPLLYLSNPPAVHRFVKATQGNPLLFASQ